MAVSFTEDRFLGGRLLLRQPNRGHRSGIEAVLLAAAVPLTAGQTVLDIGAGVGAAALCALARVSGAKAILVEYDEASAATAADNIERNKCAEWSQVIRCDVTRVGAAARAGLTDAADHAIANPPFHDPSLIRISQTKARAHAAPTGSLDLWIRFAAAAVKAGGTLTVVHRAEALEAVLAGFARRFGGICLLPLHPRPHLPATRVLVQGTKGSRAPFTILPGLVLHEAVGNAFTPQLEDILRHGASLPLAPTASALHL